MDDKKVTVRGPGLGFFSAMFLLFLGLKLANIITWSWWLVFAPLAVPVGLVAFLLLFGLLAFIIATFSKPKRRI